MSSLRSVSEQAGVPLLTAYTAMTEPSAVPAEVERRVRRAAADQRYTLRVTIRDVAIVAGVSVSTVSYVINDSALITAKTRLRVEAAIQALGYRPNSTARNLKASETRMIGYSWHRVHDVVQRNQVLDRFLYEVAQAAESNGYHILTFAQSGPHEDQSYIDLIRTSRVDGFVLSDTMYDDPRIRRLLELDFPFACFGRSNADWDFPFADDDGRRGVGLVVEHLRRQGHTHIAMLGWLEGTVVGDIRVHGYQEALHVAGLAALPDLLVRTPNDVLNASKAAAHVLSRVPRPTAIICGTDIIAIGVKTHLESSGLLIGTDVAVASYDDTPVAEALDLTSVHQKIDRIAHAVTDLVIGKIRGMSTTDRHILVAPTLVVRSSSGPMAAADRADYFTI